MIEVQHLTITGDRQAGKTKMLVDVAIDEAARQGRSVLFFTPSRNQDSYTLSLIEDRAQHLCPELIERVYRTNGRERILFKGGGLVYFREPGRESSRRHQPDVDTHIIDDVSGGDSCVGATRIFRAMIR